MHIRKEAKRGIVRDLCILQANSVVISIDKLDISYHQTLFNFTFKVAVNFFQARNKTFHVIVLPQVVFYILYLEKN